MRGAAVTGWGAALPETVVTNADLEARLDTSDAWIVERTGIRERRVGGTTASLATEAAERALERAGLRPSDIDLLVLATTTPDQAVPATSADVAHRLGLQCGAMDLNAACSGFVYALVAASGMVGGGLDRVLVVGAETLSRITDPSDRTTAVLFADAAGAVVVEAVPGESRLLGYDLGADGGLRSILYCDQGGLIVMEGQEVFRRAVRATVDSARAALERAKVTADDISLFVPHQANLRIIDAAGQRLGLPRERTAVVLDRTGNTSAASIPVALADAADAGRVSPGDLVLLSGFGAGMTWASAVLRWER
ncbi:MAG TPA: beta-ketoacyl-ACP synthase III [Acidimicrobiales bacterium]|nr:beta-ketoacyl-ACP synthase III [Acidimicrobiales bacterium]